MSSEITGKDGAAMLLIPAGDFMMGSSEGRDDEQPVHRVSLDAFYLDKYEVTNALFQKFVEKSNYETTAERQGPVAEGLACFRVANRERRGITV
jgi:formylglycine-generating enzyme required for sulfatase activity